MPGLVHDVAGDEQRGAAGPSRGKAPRARGGERVETDRRLVEHDQLRVADQRRGQLSHPGALTSGEPVDDAIPLGLRARRRRSLRPRARAAGRGTRAKYSRFSRTVRSTYTDGACVMYPMRLRSAGLPASRPKTRTVPDSITCTPTIDSDQSRFPASARAEEPGDSRQSAVHRHRQVVERRSALRGPRAAPSLTTARLDRLTALSNARPGRVGA